LGDDSSLQGECLRPVLVANKFLVHSKRS
jgi:hypothetical protein